MQEHKNCMKNTIACLHVCNLVGYLQLVLAFLDTKDNDVFKSSKYLHLYVGSTVVMGSGISILILVLSVVGLLIAAVVLSALVGALIMVKKKKAEQDDDKMD